MPAVCDLFCACVDGCGSLLCGYFSVFFSVVSVLYLAWKTLKTPGKLVEFYARPGIFGMISRFMLVLTL